MQSWAVCNDTAVAPSAPPRECRAESESTARIQFALSADDRPVVRNFYIRVYRHESIASRSLAIPNGSSVVSLSAQWLPTGLHPRVQQQNSNAKGCRKNRWVENFEGFRVTSGTAVEIPVTLH